METEFKTSLLSSRGNLYNKRGIYVHTVTPISVKGNYVCKSPDPSVQREECPRKGLKYTFELSLTVGKLIMLWLVL